MFVIFESLGYLPEATGGFVSELHKVSVRPGAESGRVQAAQLLAV